MNGLNWAKASLWASPDFTVAGILFLLGKSCHATLPSEYFILLMKQFSFNKIKMRRVKILSLNQDWAVRLDTVELV